MSNLDSKMCIEVIEALIGPIDSVADSAVDHHRYKNLIKLIEVHDGLTYMIYNESNKETSDFASMKKSGKRARDYLDSLDSLDGEP